MRTNLLSRFLLALSTITLAGGITAAAAGATTPTTTPPHIVATPNNVMVNTTVTLAGFGFPAHATLLIEECGATSWVVVAQQPCDTNNTITIATDALGRFTAPFKVELCPRVTTGTGPITREKCYIGNPQPRGVDTIRLVGAARVTVTYP